MALWHTGPLGILNHDRRGKVEDGHHHVDDTRDNGHGGELGLFLLGRRRGVVRGERGGRSMSEKRGLGYLSVFLVILENGSAHVEVSAGTHESAHHSEEGHLDGPLLVIGAFTREAHEPKQHAQTRHEEGQCAEAQGGL